MGADQSSHEADQSSHEADQSSHEADQSSYEVGNVEKTMPEIPRKKGDKWLGYVLPGNIEFWNSLGVERRKYLSPALKHKVSSNIKLKQAQHGCSAIGDRKGAKWRAWCDKGILLIL